MRWQWNIFQTKDQEKTPEELCEVEKDNLLKKEFQVMIIKMIKELRIIMNEQSKKSEVLNKELENIKNNQS